MEEKTVNMKTWGNPPRLQGIQPRYTPEELIEKAIQYFDATSERHWGKELFVGKDGRKVIQKRKIPFTLEGFYIFTGITSDNFYNYSHMTERNKHKGEKHIERAKKYKEACDWIRNVIFNQNYEGAAVGEFNSNLAARKLGLAEKKDITSNGETIKRLEGVRIELPEGVDMRKIKDIDYEDLTNQKSLNNAD